MADALDLGARWRHQPDFGKRTERGILIHARYSRLWNTGGRHHDRSRVPADAAAAWAMAQPAESVTTARRPSSGSEAAMRWLLVTADYLPHLGGSRIYCHELLSNLRRTQAFVLTREYPGTEGFDAAQPYELVRKPLREWSGAGRLREVPTYLTLFRHTLSLCRRYQIELIHCSEPLPSGLVGYACSRLLGIPFVMHCHDDPLGAPVRFQPALRRFLFRSADRVLAACNFARERVIEEGVASDRVWMVFPAVDRARFRPSSEADRAGETAAKGLEFDGRPVILTTGRLERGKGHDRVLRLMPRLIQEVPRLLYVIVGTGSLEPQLREMSKSLGIEEHVHFAGRLSDELLAACYRRAQVFALLHSPVDGVNNEGFSIVSLEASACGTPIVGSRHGGTADSIRDGKNGYRVDPDDEDESATRLLEIISDPAARERLSRAAVEVADLFDWKKSSLELEGLCHELLAHRRRPAKQDATT